MELIYTTKAFAPGGIPLQGVPVLVDRDMRLVEPVCIWFLDLIRRGRTQSPNTWSSYADAVLDFFATLERTGRPWQTEWRLVTSDTLWAYRRAMETTPSPYTGRRLSTRTINGRLRRLALFYGWAVRTGRLRRSPFEVERVRTPGVRGRSLLAHVGPQSSTQEALVLTLRQPEARPPHCLTLPEVKRLERHLCERDKLIVRWSLHTGLRRSEVLGLRRAQIPFTKDDPDDRLSPIVIRGKGGVERTIFPPASLLDRTNDYVLEERSAVVRRARKRHKTYEEPDLLWLAETGKALSKEALAKNYREARAAAGVAATFHDLRHTFAIRTLVELERLARENPDEVPYPLLTLRDLLGHRSVTTTEIYLQALHVDRKVIEARVEALYQQLDAEDGEQ
jgi:integrase